MEDDDGGAPKWAKHCTEHMQEGPTPEGIKCVKDAFAKLQNPTDKDKAIMAQLQQFEGKLQLFSQPIDHKL